MADARWIVLDEAFVGISIRRWLNNVFIQEKLRDLPGFVGIDEGNIFHLGGTDYRIVWTEIRSRFSGKETLHERHEQNVTVRFTTTEAGEF